jgi:hypothetical protein
MAGARPLAARVEDEKGIASFGSESGLLAVPGVAREGDKGRQGFSSRPVGYQVGAL